MDAIHTHVVDEIVCELLRDVSAAERRSVTHVRSNGRVAAKTTARVPHGDAFNHREMDALITVILLDTHAGLLPMVIRGVNDVDVGGEMQRSDCERWTVHVPKR